MLCAHEPTGEPCDATQRSGVSTQTSKQLVIAGRCVKACLHDDVCCLGWLDLYKYFRKKASANKQTNKQNEPDTYRVKQNSGAVSEAHQFY